MSRDQRKRIYLVHPRVKYKHYAAQQELSEFKGEFPDMDVADALLAKADAQHGHLLGRRCDCCVFRHRKGLLGRRHRFAYGLLRQVTGGLVIPRDVAALDARPRADPLVRGVDHLLEVFVRDDLLRQIAAGTDDPGVHQTAFSNSG